MDAKRVANNINNWLEDYRVITDCKGVVLGLSGGKDSTVVAMLAKKNGVMMFSLLLCLMVIKLISMMLSKLQKH